MGAPPPASRQDYSYPLDITIMDDAYVATVSDWEGCRGIGDMQEEAIADAHSAMMTCIHCALKGLEPLMLANPANGRPVVTPPPRLFARLDRLRATV